MTYERVGREELTDLTPLCRRCHAMLHELERRGEVGLDFTGFVNEERARRNREAAARRRRKRLDGDTEAAIDRDLDQMRLLLRASHERLREAASLCIRQRIDVSDELAALTDAAKALEAKLDSHQS